MPSKNPRFLFSVAEESGVSKGVTFRSQQAFYVGGDYSLGTFLMVTTQGWGTLLSLEDRSQGPARTLAYRGYPCNEDDEALISLVLAPGQERKLHARSFPTSVLSAKV